MRILVTGANGYLGAVVAPALQQAGHTVMGVDAGFFNQNFLLPNATSYTVLLQDIRDIDEASLKGFDTVVHFAALSTNPLSDINPQVTEQINHLGTKHLAQTAKQSGVKHFIFASTCCVYGEEMDEIFTEKSSTYPTTVYAITKLKAEEELRNLADKNFKVDILRNATVFGMSPSFRSDIVVNSFVLSALVTGKIHVFNNGTQWRPLVDVEDLTEVILRLLSRPKQLADLEVFNVGFNENNFMVKDIVKPLVSVIPETEVVYEPGLVKDKYSYRSDFSKLQKVFPGLKQKNGLKKAIIKLKKALLQVIEDQSMGKIPVNTTAFQRHEQIKKLMKTKELTSSFEWVK
jgi:nucleoside-diphosphate-sugar epimerase